MVTEPAAALSDGETPFPTNLWTIDDEIKTNGIKGSMRSKNNKI